MKKIIFLLISTTLLFSNCNKDDAILFEMKYVADFTISTGLNIFDTQGKLVRQLVNRNFDAGLHQITWDGKTDNGADLPIGQYFYQLMTDKQISSGKIVLLK